jgi:hypothetical protein
MSELDEARREFESARRVARLQRRLYEHALAELEAAGDRLIAAAASRKGLRPRRVSGL